MKRLRDLPRLVARSIAVVWHAARRAFIATIVLNTFSGALLLVELVVLKVVLGRFVDVGSDAPVGRLVGPVAVFVAGLAIGGVVAVVSNQFSWLAGEQVAREVQGMVGEAASRAALIDFEHPSFHDRLERTMTNIVDRPYGVVMSMSGLMTSGFGALAATVKAAFHEIQVTFTVQNNHRGCASSIARRLNEGRREFSLPLETDAGMRKLLIVPLRTIGQHV